MASTRNHCEPILLHAGGASASLSKRERRGQILGGDVPKGVRRKGERGGGYVRKVEQVKTMYRPGVDVIQHVSACQPSFDPSPAHADCAEAYMWRAQIRHISAAQTLNGLTLCAQRGIVTLAHSTLP